MIGDPTGRNVTPAAAVAARRSRRNAKTYTDQVFLVLDREKTEVALQLRHGCMPLGADGMIKLAAHYTVARMLERDDFAKRFRADSRSRSTSSCTR